MRWRRQTAEDYLGVAHLSRSNNSFFLFHFQFPIQKPLFLHGQNYAGATSRGGERNRRGRGQGYVVRTLTQRIDCLGVGPLIKKLEKGKEKKDTGDLSVYEEPTDSESEDDERFNFILNFD